MLDRYNSRKPSTGTLYLTATHLIFVDPDAKKETWVKGPSSSPMLLIALLEPAAKLVLIYHIN